LIPHVPVEDAPGWVRKTANAINALITATIQKDGNALYTAPTISNPPTQAEVQAIADAVQAISDRLK